MTLADFKTIFFWEYVHRLLGRLIGLAFALPLLWFAWRRAIPRRLRLEAGGAARARRAAGRDRLVDGRLGPGRRARGQPHPARRPPAHRARSSSRRSSGSRSTLGHCAAIPKRRRRGCRCWRSGRCASCSCNSCSAPMSPGSRPAMPSTAGRRWASEWFPADTPMLEPWLRNFADNPIVVQFVHRWLAFVVAAFAIWLARARLAAGLPGGGRGAGRRGGRADPARHPHLLVGGADRHRGGAPGDGGAAARAPWSTAAHRLGETKA